MYFGLRWLKKFSLLDCLQLQKSFPSTRLQKYIKSAGYRVAGGFTELYSTQDPEAWCNSADAIRHNLIMLLVQITRVVVHGACRDVGVGPLPFKRRFKIISKRS